MISITPHAAGRRVAMARTCEKCNTPLDDEGNCVTCEADAEGLKLLVRSGYASVREMNNALEAAGLAPEMEQVPAARPEEKVHPLWNLYADVKEVEASVTILRKHWAELLDNPAASAAAQRGIAGIDLDKGGEIECPACGQKFVLDPGKSECPECGLGLGAPAEASPDEAERR
jgi:Zn finger protein HypA/HybF involved in hydrogenase expression